MELVVLPFQAAITPTSDEEKILVTEDFTLCVSTSSVTNSNKGRQKVSYL